MIRRAAQTGLRAARQNLVPGLILQALGVALVLSYYNIESVANALNALGDLKQRHTIPFAFISTAFFGSIVPWVAAAVFTPQNHRSPARHLPWLILYWGYSGVQVNFFYDLQATLFGTGTDVWTIVKKTSFDQFVFSVFVAVPQMTMAYLFIAKDLSWQKTKAALREKGFLERAIPVLIGNLGVWLPAISIIYLFPLPLQLPLANLVLGFWCLLLTFFANE